MAFPISRTEIAKTENVMGITFPESFISSMVINNGGDITVRKENWQLIPFKNNTTRKTLIRTCNDIISELKSIRQWENFPENAIPFASNECGDYLVFLNNNNTSLDDMVYHWNHETGTLTALTPFEQIINPS
jgi:antitoxin component of MazEF toxin-antitoxin module